MIIEKYQKLISRDIETIINYIFDNYTVEDKTTEKRIDRKEIISHFLSKGEDVIQRCCGINQNGSRCSRNTLENKMYCKIHILKFDTSLFKTCQHQHQHQHQVQEETKSAHPNISELDKIFIDNSFYYVDEKYMYDVSTGEKVGFQQNGEYIVSNDPFILGID
jgi:hypothetical protein